mmetsp:Transcript_3484/g.6544  ORF Transcript_3484/g.6544 Transcript_3484/m.6544 type:complete len:218 (-) Transcript_3484:52-705(-)
MAPRSLWFLEAEFVAEDLERVWIVPSMKMAVVSFIGGDAGPFVPGLEAEVPLWIGLALRKVGRCRVRAPQWMTVPQLRMKVEEERRPENAAVLTEVPFYFAEVAHVLVQHAAEDLVGPAEIVALIEDLINVREAKLRRFIQQNVNTKLNAVKLTNLASIELNKIRTHFTASLEVLFQLGSVEGDSNTEETSTAPTASRNVPTPAEPRQLRRLTSRKT